MDLDYIEPIYDSYDETSTTTYSHNTNGQLATTEVDSTTDGVADDTDVNSSNTQGLLIAEEGADGNATFSYYSCP